MNELEKQFFECFGIEPKHNDGCRIADKYWNNEKLANKYGTFDIYMDKNCVEENSGACFSTCEFAYDNEQYPEITDRKLLELICILSGCCNCTLEFKTRNIEELKNGILKQAIERTFYALNKGRYKKQVKALFEDKEQ